MPDKSNGEPAWRFWVGKVIIPIVVALIGLVGVILVANLNLLSSSPPISPTPPFPSARPTVTASTISNAGEIIVPANYSDNLAHDTGHEITGTFNSQFSGESLWILVYRDAEYWPQAFPDCETPPHIMDIFDDNRFNGWFYLGLPNRVFDVVLVATEDGVEQFFHDWLERGCNGEGYPGIPRSELPDGVIELAFITVRTGE